jgi:hypothetical protein
MRSLYDVFRAVQADECDHVSTMQSCLDENQAIVSPSLEKRVLMGTGIITAAAGLLYGGDFADTTNLSFLDVDGLAFDGVSAELDAILAGAIALISQLFRADSDALIEAGEVAGSVEAVKNSGILAQILGEGFAAGFLTSKLFSSKKIKSQDEQTDEVQEATKTTADDDDTLGVKYDD